MDIDFYTFARRAILRTLIYKNKWGASHTHYSYMFSGIPKHQRGAKEAKRAADDLLKEGKIILKKTTGDDHVSLNPDYSQEIKAEAFSKKE